MTTTQTNNSQLHRKLMTLFSKQGFSDSERHDLVWQYTNGRTQSTKYLTDSEMAKLCDFLENKNAELELLLRKRRATVLAIAQRCDIHDPENWSKFNRFMLSRSILKKPLKEYNLEEINKLIQQFRKLEENYNRSANNYNTKAFWHRGARLAEWN